MHQIRLGYETRDGATRVNGKQSGAWSDEQRMQPILHNLSGADIMNQIPVAQAPPAARPSADVDALPVARLLAPNARPDTEVNKTASHSERPSSVVGLPQKADILGIGVSAISIDIALATIEQWIARRTQNYVCVTGAHGVIECQDNARLRAVHNNAGLVTPDGMPLVWMCHALGFKQTTRVYGPDLMLALSEVSAQRGYRQFYYGGGEGVADLLKQRMSERSPGLSVVGTLTPPFRQLSPQEEDEVAKTINDAKPDILWVGLSTPKQELWMASYLGRLDVPVMIGVGAAFDFLSGQKPQAPLWMQRNGLEWLYRLGSEPGRLWRRYLRIVPMFIMLAGLQLVKARMRGPVAGRVPS